MNRRGGASSADRARDGDKTESEPIYGPFEERRYIPEPGKRSVRTNFERDRARILHSAGFRRLGTKTQVLGPSQDDFVRTRLTHSLEVAQIGREIGKELGADPDIVDAACLAHDLGHPPFGHNGERALDEVCGQIGGFEGNAQTFRLVARLEAKMVGERGPAGLNLTRATLDSLCKYPWMRGQGPDPVKSLAKFGVYADDAGVFDWMRQGAPAAARPLEAQVMDFSDDIGYSVHDLEDAVITGRCNIGQIDDEGVIASAISWYGGDADQLDTAARRLQSLDFWPRDYVDSYRGRAQMKDLTSQLIGRFCSRIVDATRARYGDEPLGRYRADLVVPDEVRAEVLFLKGVAVHYVMSPRELEPIYNHQRTLLFDLVDALVEGGPDELEGPFAEEWRAAEDEGGRLRAVIDQVACLTDFSATQWHARLCGMLSTLF